MKLIKPHGGNLVNRQVTGPERERLIEASRDMPTLHLSAREISDLEMIATGAYSPLEGFLDRADYSSVCVNMRLASGPLSGGPLARGAASGRQVPVRQRARS
jgi:sulfate adenylyltransferase